LIVEDHRLFADVVRSALEAEGLDVAGVAGDGAAAVQLAHREEPDVVLIDLGLPDRSGLSVGQEILESNPDVMVVALSAMDDPRTIAEARRLGFRGYLTKDASVGKLVRTVRAVAQGETVMPFAGSPPRAERDAAPVFLVTQLTPREREVLELLARGESGASMAQTLDISANTVRTHVQSILTKLQVHSRLEAVAVAVRHSLIELPGTAAGGPRLTA
jgi:two-component system nitrate/nitrite response regulator NarL